MPTLRSLFSHPSERTANAVCLVFALAGCIVDLITGADYSPLFFYIPTAIYAAWFCSSSIGRLCITLISASIVAVNFGNSAERVGIEAASFNGATRVATIVLVYWAIRRLHVQMQALRRLNDRLEEVDRQKDKLFGVISHDLRSPFNAVLGYSELLERSLDGASEKTRQHARECHDAARSAYDLLDNLLRWAQIQMKRTELRPSVFEASALVGRCMETHRPAADLKKIKLSAESNDPKLMCFADFSAAETVLRNLVNNAIKFTPSGGSVVVGVRSVEGSVEFFVRDSGVGLTSERLGQLFTLAASPTSPGTQGERGIGLGLAMCKDLADQCNGTIRAESTAGSGSCFWFTLPDSQGPGGKV